MGITQQLNSRFLCSECVDEMHKLGHMVKMGAVVIHVSPIIYIIWLRWICTWQSYIELFCINNHIWITFSKCLHIPLKFINHKSQNQLELNWVTISQDYIRDNYCPTLGDHQHFCRESLSRYYVGMLVRKHHLDIFFNMDFMQNAYFLRPLS